MAGLKSAVRSLTPRARRSKTPIGNAGYDNVRENIDPHIKTKVLSTKDIYGRNAYLSGGAVIDGTISGLNGYIISEVNPDAENAIRIVSTTQSQDYQIGHIDGYVNYYNVDSNNIAYMTNQGNFFLSGQLLNLAGNETYEQSGACVLKAGDMMTGTLSGQNIIPTVNLDYSLGSFGKGFDSLYLKKWVSDFDGTTSLLQRFFSPHVLACGVPFVPIGNGVLDLGVAVGLWRNLYLSGASIIAGIGTFARGLIVGTGTGDQILADNGTSAAPGYSFQGDTNTGIGQVSDRMRFYCGATQVMEMGIQYVRIGRPGSTSQAALSVGNDADSGLYMPSLDKLGITAGGIEFLRLDEASAQDEMIFNVSGVDIDHRIEAVGKTHAFFVQGSDGNVGIDTATPTTCFSVKEKSGNTPIGGFAIRMTNKAGANSVSGQLVVASTTTADAISGAGASSAEVIGVTLDSGVADGSEVWVIVAGIADVLIDAGGSAVGDRMISSATAGSADVWNTGGAVATHFQEIGHCIETRAGAGLARCVLHFN